jgi:hypothetical protein
MTPEEPAATAIYNKNHSPHLTAERAADATNNASSLASFAGVEGYPHMQGETAE